MTSQMTPTPNPYQSETPARGDCRAIPTTEPAQFETSITISSYPLTNPRNYIGYTIALAKSGDRQEADRLVEETLVKAVNEARRGAHHLGLIQPTSSSRDYELTEQGTLVAQKADDVYGGYDATLNAFREMKRSRQRFASTHTTWSEIGPSIAQSDPAIAYLVSLLQQAHKETGREEFPLHELTQDYLFQLDPGFTVHFFFNNEQTLHDKIASTIKSGDYDVFSKTSGYRATVTYQLKSTLYHLDVLTKSGKDTSRHDPTTDYWGLTPRLL